MLKRKTRKEGKMRRSVCVSRPERMGSTVAALLLLLLALLFPLLQLFGDNAVSTVVSSVIGSLAAGSGGGSTVIGGVVSDCK
jgi:hypothetical protein